MQRCMTPHAAKCIKMQTHSGARASKDINMTAALGNMQRKFEWVLFLIGVQLQETVWVWSSTCLPNTGFVLWPINVYQSLLRRKNPKWKHCRKYTRTSLSCSICSPASTRPASKSSLIKDFSSSVSFESSMSPAGPPGSTGSPSASHRPWLWSGISPLDEMERRCLEARLFLDL